MLINFFPQLAAPKSKYVEAILSATHGGEAGVAEIFRTLQLRMRDSTWTIVFKSLIIVHLMIREGNPDVTLRYIAESPKRLAISNFADGELHNLQHQYCNRVNFDWTLCISVGHESGVLALTQHFPSSPGTRSEYTCLCGLPAGARQGLQRYQNGLRQSWFRKTQEVDHRQRPPERNRSGTESDCSACEM